MASLVNYRRHRPSWDPAVNPRLKMDLCKFYENGFCRLAKNCTFAHGRSDLRRNVYLSEDDDTLPSDSTKTVDHEQKMDDCKIFENGFSQGGEKSMFAYNRNDLQRSVSQSETKYCTSRSTIMALQPRRKTNLSKNFENGICHLGEKYTSVDNHGKLQRGVNVSKQHYNRVSNYPRDYSPDYIRKNTPERFQECTPDYIQDNILDYIETDTSVCDPYNINVPPQPHSRIDQQKWCSRESNKRALNGDECVQIKKRKPVLSTRKSAPVSIKSEWDSTFQAGSLRQEEEFFNIAPVQLQYQPNTCIDHRQGCPRESNKHALSVKKKQHGGVGHMKTTPISSTPSTALISMKNQWDPSVDARIWRQEQKLFNNSGQVQLQYQPNIGIQQGKGCCGELNKHALSVIKKNHLKIADECIRMKEKPILSCSTVMSPAMKNQWDSKALTEAWWREEELFNNTAPVELQFQTNNHVDEREWYPRESNNCEFSVMEKYYSGFADECIRLKEKPVLSIPRAASELMKNQCDSQVQAKTLNQKEELFNNSEPVQLQYQPNTRMDKQHKSMASDSMRNQWDPMVDARLWRQEKELFSSAPVQLQYQPNTRMMVRH